jgi:hypothetical protein
MARWMILCFQNKKGAPPIPSDAEGPDREGIRKNSRALALFSNFSLRVRY